MRATRDQRAARLTIRLLERRGQRLRATLAALEEAMGEPGEAEANAVHDVRVASRRLAAALELAGGMVPAKRRSKCERELRRLVRRLGRARDLDVQTALLDRLAGKGSPAGDRPGIERLRLRLSQARVRAGRKIRKMLGRLDGKGDGGEVGRLAAWIREARKSPPRDAQGGDANQSALDAAAGPSGAPGAASLLHAAVGAIASFDASVYVPGDAEKLHELRIAVKRARYLMELARPVSRGRFDEALRYAERLQSLLGELHDCDVWIALLPGFIEAERERTEEYFGHARAMGRLMPGLQAVLENRREARRRTYRRMLECWREAMAARVWSRAAGEE